VNVPDPALRDLLLGARTIAVVGLSDKPERDSYGVAQYLQGQGYRIVPVNPATTEILGERAYPSLSAVPADLRLDLVDIFRRSDQVPPIVDEAVQRGVRAVWMQLGVENAAAAEKGQAAGLLVVEDRCLRTEHQRLRVPPVGGSD
jgi:uncharacterized protein